MCKRTGRINILVGNILGLIINPWLPLSPCPDQIDFEQALFLEETYVAEIDFTNGEKLIYPSLSGGYDLFYRETNGEIVYHCDFFEIVNEKDILTYD